jgi:hypothetical protein
VNVGDPVPGLYRARRSARHPWRPVRIFYHEPVDPETGEPLDRPRPLTATIGGKYVNPFVIWSWCADKPIDQAEYDYLMTLAAMPGQPEATPEKPVNLQEMPPVYSRRNP